MTRFDHVNVVLQLVQFALDVAVIILLACSPVIWFVIFVRSQRNRAWVRAGYLGYATCAAVVGLFQLHLYVDGPAIFMMFNWFAVPAVVAGTLALIMTITARFNVTLWILAGATGILGLFQVLTLMGIIGPLMNPIARAYVLIVLGAYAYRGLKWWSAGRQSAP